MTSRPPRPALRAGSSQLPLIPGGQGAPDKAAARRRTAGILLMLLATMLLTVMQSLVRYIGQEIHPFEVAFFRNLFGGLILVPYFWRHGLIRLATSRPGMHLLRGVMGTFSMLTWFYGLAHVPLAEATALSFIGIVFGSIGAVIYLGETMRLRRWTAVAVSFTGVIVMLRPGFADIDLGLWAVLVSSVTWGLALVVVKNLLRTDSAICVVAWTSVSLLILTFIPMMTVWSRPSGTQLLVMAVIGVIATAGHLAVTQSLKLADVTTVLPLDFTRLVWAVAIGVIAFAEFPDPHSIAGSVLIVLGAAYIVRREQGSPG
jgi:drug/metabolite transporter (DMT)-like permease